MALKKTITTIHGITVADAYHRVERISMQGKFDMTFVVKSYADSAADKEPLASLPATCAYSINGANPIAQAYEHAKTLIEFADAEDC